MTARSPPSPNNTGKSKLISFLFFLILLLQEDIKDEMKLNANITKMLSEAKTKFSDDEHEVRTRLSVVINVIV